MGNKEKRKLFQEKKELFMREVDLVKSATKVVFEKSSFIDFLLIIALRLCRQTEKCQPVGNEQ